MPTNCLNCGTPLTDKYCPHCGQKATVKRLSWHYVAEELLHFFTHIEHGFLKTTGLLITKPGLLNKNFLDGKRKNYHKPISFLLIWIAIFLLVYHFVNRYTHYENLNTSTVISNDPAVTAMINKYRSLVEILILPVSAFIAWLIIARRKLNYVEVLNTAFYGFSFLFILLATQFTIAFIFGINFKTNSFDISGAVIFLCWNFYASYDLFKRYRVPYLIPRIILTIIAGTAVYSFLSKEIAKRFIDWGF